MVDSKKYNGSQWEHSLRKLTTATEAVENPLYSDGTAITAYTISGNTVQNGTPTPDNPVEVNGVGERTENLVPPDLTRNYMALQGVTDGITYCVASTGGALYVIPASNSETYTIKVHTGDETLSILRCGFIDIATPTAGRQVTQAKEIVNAKNPSLTTTNSANKPYFIFQISGSYATEHGLANVMCNSGSTALPYEPYGYKIPISNGQQTTNIYLGSTQTVRQVKKLVLDGTEDWHENPCAIGYRFALPITSAMQSDTTIGVRSMCTHQILVGTDETYRTLGAYTISDTSELFMTLNGDTRLATWKSWLAAQYTNGTPVTVWYVLATEETATVNEPLMKIGDYADTLSNAASIPITEGANSITVDTTVQPSEFTATWTGWHNANVKEWNGSQWNE